MATYIIKSILCSGILLLLYHLFLEREKMHRFNRLYLLLAVGFSFLVPLISIEVPQENIPVPFTVETPIEKLPENVLYKPIYQQTESNSDWAGYAPICIYGLVTLALLFRLTRNFRSILVSKNRYKKIQYEGAQMVLVPESIVTYSFLNYIFVGEMDFDQNKIEPEVLIHELAHVQQRHSLDIVAIELIQALLWFNPLLFFYRKAIQLNHEFLADDAVLSESANVKNYQLILLDKILYKHTVNLTSSFNFSITKKRLAMMTRTTNRNQKMIKQGAITLLAFGLIFVFSEKIYSQKKSEAPIQKTEPVVESEKSKSEASAISVKRPKAIYEQESGTGLSADELKEFRETIEKHTKYIKNKKGRTDLIVDMTPAMQNQMYDLYTRMSKDQQLQQFDSGLTMFKMDIPVKKSPTPEMFEKWKIPTIFGLWINNKHVPNSELDKYTYSDIAEYDLSKLYGGALKGRIYKYQLNILTNEYFDKTYEARVADRVLISRRGFSQPLSK